MKLFDDLERLDASAPSQHRSEYAFLNTTGIAIAGRMRALLEDSFTHYSGEKARLQERVRSNENKTHVAAVLELLLHELTRRRGLQPQADSPLGAGLPDQRILLATGEHAFVEARMLEPGDDGLYEVLRDAIDEVRRPGVLYYLRLHRPPARALSIRKLQAQLRAHVDALTINALSARHTDREHAFLLKDEDKLILEVIPFRRPGSEGGIDSFDEAPINFSSAAELRRGLERKNRKYRDVEVPYIIAICSAKGYARDEHVEEALFREGSGEYRGFFVRSPRATVSAVLACQRFKPSAFRPRLRLYLNPNAAHPLAANPFGCDMVERRGGELARTQGLSFQAMMDLAPQWPEE